MTDDDCTRTFQDMKILYSKDSYFNDIPNYSECLFRCLYSLLKGSFGCPCFHLFISGIFIENFYLFDSSRFKSFGA